MIENQTVIECQNAEIWQQKNLVLCKVSLQISAGELVYLIGKTGTGKSSLLKTLYGELTLQSGEITIAGFNLTKLKSKDIPFLRRQLGVVFQDFQLLTDRTVADNLHFVLQVIGWKNKQKREQRIKEVLNLVGIETKAHKMPFQLSGGEQQRLAIARALINNPMVILADEPTGSLDPDTSLEILKLFKQIAEKGTAVLIATHDYYLIDKFPARLLKIEQQTVVDFSTLLHA